MIFVSTKTKTVRIDVLHGVQHRAHSPWQSRVKLFCIKRGDITHRQCLLYTPPKTNMDTQNDALEMVTPSKYGHFWYLC